MQSDEYVNWFYCQRCKKDVETRLDVEVEWIDVANRKVHLNVLAVCVECDEVVHEVGGGVEMGLG